MHKLLTVLCLSVVATFTTLTGPSAGEEVVDPRALKDAFFKTVFGLEYGGHADAFRVKRFEGPVRFFVDDRSGVGRALEARRFLNRLPRHIGHLRAEVVDRRSRANFNVVLVRDKDFAAVVASELRADSIAMNARCLVGVTTLNGRIQQSTAVIVADDDFLFSRCLVEEVLQGLGPMNDDDSLTESVFNDQSQHATFTKFDQALMNVLYHPMIRPGMTDSEAFRTLPQVFADLGLSH
ncbi:DUF2927 domain-containing protein [Acuticoccus sp. I52.16.1]|uniref:DUF2927 domain-containing protein n=1 Tax=Acuticoccus sp. I52.16.1 TaxID=2928472 RepID=UPI001FD2EE1F|nr:DUF2927 domain-containing protein [Acuticoccus sp. I52.16.1]UOM33388.1 DUF2927 domain-containing protein [Acuticoccus sp. I52.16.1]